MLFRLILLILIVLLPCRIWAETTTEDLLKQNLDESGIKNSGQVVRSVEKSMGGSLSAIPLYDRIDFSEIPYAKLNVTKLGLPACLVLTPSAVNYVFKGKPDSFQGSFRKYEFHIGEGLSNAAQMIYPQVFEEISLSQGIAGAGQDAIAIVPETVDFRFRMGGAFRPSLIASIKIKVGMYHAGQLFFEKVYEVNDVKKSSYTIFPSKKQEHKAISKAIIDALKLNAEEIRTLPPVIAILNRSVKKPAASIPPPSPPENEAGTVPGQWVENKDKHDFDNDTEKWLRENQHQIARAENRSTQNLLKREETVIEAEPGTIEPGTTEIVEPEPAEDESESYYVPLPEAYTFVPTELEKKRWAARKAQIDLARAEREEENRQIEREDKLAKIKNNEAYAKRLNDNTWIYNNAVSETIIDHGDNIILGAKTIVVLTACAGPQAAATCAPVTGTMVSYGRFDSLAAGIGEGTAEYNKSGDVTKAITKGAVTGSVDYAAGWAGGKVMKGAGSKLLDKNKALSESISSNIREKAFNQTKSGTGKFIQGAMDTRIKSHIYKANKNMLKKGLQTAAVDGFGVEMGKKANKKVGLDGQINDIVDKIMPQSPTGRQLGGGE